MTKKTARSNGSSRSGTTCSLLFVAVSTFTCHRLEIIGRCGRMKCPRLSRKIASDQMFYVVTCTDGCHILYHKDTCWRALTREFLKV